MSGPSVVGERVLDAAYARQRRSDGWRQATCAGCGNEMLCRGEGVPCCSIVCAHRIDAETESARNASDER